MKKKLTAAFSAMLVLSAVQAAGAEELNSYDMQRVTVIGNQALDEFGNVITEQSYYRTGGDVTVIGREEIEKKHYKSIEEALKDVPGVFISGNGTHSNIIGMIGSGSNYSDELTINGDSHVIFMVNGKRVGNEAMDLGGPGVGGNTVMSMLNMIDAVEKIEVMKGASAAVYGADATGGAINIITRKGSEKPVTAVRMATGSWKQHNYAISHSGSANKGKTSYFITASREQNGDTKYKDGKGKNYTFKNTSYKQDGVFMRVDHSLNDQQSITFDYAHTDNVAHYPTAAPDWDTMSDLWDGTLLANRPLGYSAPGYRNWFYLGAIHGNYIRYNDNQYNLQYTFAKDHGMESFIRVYYDLGRAENMDYAGNGGLMNKAPSVLLDKEYVENFKKGRTEVHNVMRNAGINVQYAKKVGVNNLITAVDYRHNTYRWDNQNRNQYIDSERDFVYAWLQDKIEVSDKLVVTPSLRYAHYGTISSQYLANHLNYKSNDRFTFGIHSNYKFDDSASMYLSVANVYRPITYMDYDSEAADERINPEKGMNYLVGFNKHFGKNTMVGVNYSYMDMSNALGRYPVWNEAQGKSVTKLVNATQKKSALNLELNHKFDEHWGVKASYSYMHDNFKAKNFKIVSVEKGTTVDDMINSYRPSGIYRADVNYANGKFDCGLNTTVYAGMDKEFFSDGRFIVMGFDANYKLTKNSKLFLTVDNITNEAYETKARSFFGKGAYPQPGRSFMLGVECKF